MQSLQVSTNKKISFLVIFDSKYISVIKNKAHLFQSKS